MAKHLNAVCDWLFQARYDADDGVSDITLVTQVGSLLLFSTMFETDTSTLNVSFGALACRAVPRVKH